MSSRTVIFITACALAFPAAALAQSSQTEKPKRDASSTSKDTDSCRFMDDAMITTRIKVEYAKDELVQATRISVNTDKGVVRLSGVANSQAEADKAESIAKNTEGVISVKNEIKVEPEPASK
jgi:hyperosmotically inducible protein